jgi:branched-chain amino acid transport system substrate-binding protein
MHYGVTEPAFVEALGKDANQVIGAAVWTATAKTKSKILWPTAASYAAASIKTFNTPADYTQAGSSAAGIAFQVALQKIGATPGMSEALRTQLIKALEQVDIDTFYGKVKFATTGQYYHANVGMTPLTVQIQDGKTVIIGPTASKEAAPQYPMKAWKGR